MSYATNASTPAADLSYDVGSNGIRSMEYPKKSTVSGMEIKQEFLVKETKWGFRSLDL